MRWRFSKAASASALSITYKPSTADPMTATRCHGDGNVRLVTASTHSAAAEAIVVR